jgi:predicted DNA-binding transcriptional regulator AlpA
MHPVGQFWRLDRVVAETGLCVRSIYEAMANGTFPRNFPISKQARAWASDEIEAWNAAKFAERDKFDRASAADAARARRRGGSKRAGSTLPSGTAANDRARQAQNQIRGFPGRLEVRGPNYALRDRSE